jgi:hypothetical protein
MCTPDRSDYCVDAATAHAWWGSPMLVPFRKAKGEFVLFPAEGRLGAGEGEGPGNQLLLLLSYGGRTARDGNHVEVIKDGGIAVYASRTTRDLGRPTDARTVPVRGNVAFLGEATSATTGLKLRTLTWTTDEGDHFIRWRVMDLREHRSLDALVHVVEDDLREL